jgi:DMSO/TMAO reductase YedYZ molybdopterin-dependent catalytic subunit
MAAFSLLLRSLTSELSIVELLGEAVLQALPIGLFSFLLETLGERGKPLLVVAVVIGVCLAGGGVAQLHSSVAMYLPPGKRIFRFISLVFGAWVPLVIIAIIATAVGTTDVISNQRLLAICLIVALDAIVYAAGLYLLFPAVRTLTTSSASTRVDVDAPAASEGRRRLIAAVGSSALVVVGAGVVGRFVLGIKGGAIGGGRVGVPDPVTPNNRFYLVSKNFVDPSVDQDGWRLDITGKVNRPHTLAMVDLLALPQQQQEQTLTCISNEIGGDLISNAVWTGVRLVDLLTAAGIQPDTREVVLYAADGYTESLPLEKVMEPTTMLVYQMNGEPLPRRHGFPARLIVPGKYGIKNVKWITRINAISGDFKGYWQHRGWTEEATIHTLSRIDIPTDRSIVSRGPVELGGIAFAGDRGISRVELSADGGATWQDADQIQQIAPLSWVIWRSTWNPPASGAFTVKVRAVDGQGVVQPDGHDDPIPNGATGYHAIDIGVA